MKIVYLLVKGSDNRTFWNRAGAAFQNSDGSLNVKLDFFPDLTFQVRDVKPKDAQ